MNRLAIIQTGGTIASRPDASGGLRPDSAVNSLIAALPELKHFDLTLHQPFNLPSPHVTPAHMHGLRDLIAALTPDHDGVVVTHGTDTLEETAFYLHLTLPPELPVVVTGSMRHAEEPSWDGPGNVLDAARVAMHPASSGRGVLVTFGGDIFDARTVTKIHTTSVDAFGGSPGPIGRIDAFGEGLGALTYFARPEPREVLDPPDASAKVEILYAYAGWRGEGLEAALARADGVVIAALGTGNLPPDLVPIIRAATKPVVIATRTHTGPILPLYGYEGGGRQLQQIGAIPASFLNAHKARILLIALLSSGVLGESLRRAFAEF